MLGGVAGHRARPKTGTVMPQLPHTRRDAGMATAEYAVATVAAAAFAGLLFKIVTSGDVRALVLDIINRALNLAG